MKLREAFCATALTALLATSAGCGQTSASEQQAGTDGGLEVVTSFYPLQFVTEQIAGDHATVSSLTTPGQEPHDLELTPKQVGSLAEADLVVYLSDFQGAVDDAVKQSTPRNIVDAATLVTPLDAAEQEAHAHESEGATEGEDEGHDHGEEGHEGHDHGGTDPHVWLAPKNMVKIADGITAKLVEVDPDHQSDYQANKTKLVTSLTTLDGEYQAGLKNCQRTEFITSHAAFGHLAHEYGLTQIGISGLSPDNEPSPARIAEVQAEAKEHGITTVFYETLVSPEISKSIAGDLGLKTAVLDPIEGITDESQGKDYLEVMQSNLSALRSANQCQ